MISSKILDKKEVLLQPKRQKKKSCTVMYKIRNFPLFKSRIHKDMKIVSFELKGSGPWHSKLAWNGSRYGMFSSGMY